MELKSSEDFFIDKTAQATHPFTKLPSKIKNSISKFHPLGFRRELGLVDLILIGVGSTIEGSIFVLIAPGAAIAGIYLPFSFFLGALLALAVAFIYAEVAANMPEEGVDLRFIFKSFSSDVWAFVTSWLVILGDLAYFVLNLLGLSIYLGAILPINQLAFALATLFAVAALNLFGIQRVNFLEKLVTIALIFFISLFIGWVFFNQVGAGSLSMFGLEDIDSGVIFAIIAGTALIYSSFIGYEDITSVAGEVKNPHLVIPRALIATVLITSAIYISISFLAVSTVPIENLQESKTPILLMAQVNHVPTFLVTIAAVLAIVSTLIVSLLVASRKVFALSQEGYLHNLFGRLNSRGTPTVAVLFCSVVAVLLLISGSVKFVAYLGNSVYLIGVIATTIALLLMRHKDANFGKWFRAPLYPVLPAVVIVFSAFVLFFIERGALYYVLGWSIIGALIYYFKKIFNTS